MLRTSGRRVMVELPQSDFEPVILLVNRDMAAKMRDDER
jgi:hypothetical protein